MSSKKPYHYNERNQRSIQHFIDNLFHHNAKLLTVRVDLGYKMNQTVATEYTEFYQHSDNDLCHPDLPPHAYLSKAIIMANWNELLNRLRWYKRDFLAQLVGYVWKIEYGQDKGIHYHLVLFFNGNRVQKDHYYADKLGELWAEITKGDGLYFNCSIDKHKRYGENNALKVTHRKDDRSNLYQTLNYLTKMDDNEVMARALSGGRIFGKSSG